VEAHLGGAIGTVILAGKGDANGLLACLVPLVCAYVDLISIHLMIRIITIGAYLRERGDRYEDYTFTRGKDLGRVRIFSKQLPCMRRVWYLTFSFLGQDLYPCTITNLYLLYRVSITFIFCGFLGGSMGRSRCSPCTVLDSER